MVSGLKRHTSAGVLTGLRLRFHYHEGLVATLTELADSEQAACSGINHCLRGPAGHAAAARRDGFTRGAFTLCLGCPNFD